MMMWVAIGITTPYAHASSVIDTVNNLMQQIKESITAPQTETAPTDGSPDSESSHSYPTQSCRKDLRTTLATCAENSACKDSAWSEFRTCVHDSLKTQTPVSAQDVIEEAQKIFVEAESMSDCFKATEIRQKCGTDSLCRQKIFDGFNNCAQRFMADDDAPMVNLDALATQGSKPAPQSPKVSTQHSRKTLEKIKLQAEIDALEAENQYLETEIASFDTQVAQARASFQRENLLKKHSKHTQDVSNLQKKVHHQTLDRKVEKLFQQAKRTLLVGKEIQDFRQINTVIDGRLKIINVHKEARDAYEAWLSQYKEKVPVIDEKITKIDLLSQEAMSHIGVLKKRQKDYETLENMKKDTLSVLLGTKNAVDLSSKISLTRMNFLTDIPALTNDLKALEDQETKATEKYTAYKTVASIEIPGIATDKTLPDGEAALTEIKTTIAGLKKHIEKLTAQKKAHDTLIAEVQALHDGSKKAADEALTRRNTESKTDRTYVEEKITEIIKAKGEAQSKYAAWKTTHNDMAIPAVETTLTAIADENTRTDNHLKTLQIGILLHEQLNAIKKQVSEDITLTSYAIISGKEDQLSKTIATMKNELKSWETTTKLTSEAAKKIITQAEAARKPADDHRHKLKIIEDTTAKRNEINAKATELKAIQATDPAQEKLKEMATLRDSAKEAYTVWKTSTSLSEDKVDPIFVEMDSIYQKSVAHVANVTIKEDIQEFYNRLVKMDTQTRAQAHTIASISPRVDEMRATLQRANETHEKWKGEHKRELPEVLALMEKMKTPLQSTESHFSYWSTVEKTKNLEKETATLLTQTNGNMNFADVQEKHKQALAKQEEAKAITVKRAKDFPQGGSPSPQILKNIDTHIKGIMENLKKADKEGQRKIAMETGKKLSADIQKTYNDIQKVTDFTVALNTFKSVKEVMAKLQKNADDFKQTWKEEFAPDGHRGIQSGTFYLNLVESHVKSLGHQTCGRAYEKELPSCITYTKGWWGRSKNTNTNCTMRLEGTRRMCTSELNDKVRAVKFGS
ncbi:MAG: hypothetical protein H6849_01160 [Alphaproteobacteria bacterium]|nr:MAG: hypothetical protein H6849_01160 [Alphaproteobacteria bacterium]